MNIFLIIVIALLIILFALYAFWLKLLKGKPGRIAGADVEKKTFEEALVVDVRWRKEYARGHAINQYNYGNAIYSNALLSEFKYRISASENKQFLNLGSEILNDDEIRVSPEEIDSVLDKLDKSSEIFVYSDKPEQSKAVCKKLGLDGYTIINLIEPFNTKVYRNAFYNKNDYIESQDEKEAATCSA